MLHEETLEAVLALLRFHLVNNVLAFHDVYLQRQHRPTLADGMCHDNTTAAPRSALSRTVNIAMQ